MAERIVQLKVDPPSPVVDVNKADKENEEQGVDQVAAVERQVTTTAMLEEQGGKATAGPPGGENENTTAGPTDASPAMKEVEVNYGKKTSERGGSKK